MRDRMKSLTLLTRVESLTMLEIEGTFRWLGPSASIRASSLLLNLLTLRLILFLKAFATRAPTARPYEGGGEYFGGASFKAVTVLGSGNGSTTGGGCCGRGG